MTTVAAAMTPRRVPVVLYLAVSADHDPEPLRESCQRYAQARPWRVAAEVIDVVEPWKPPGRRPGWRRTRKLIVEGWAHGVLTYAFPMIAIGRDQYTDIELWAAHRACFLAAAWAPHEGELVRDTSSADRIGVYKTQGEKDTAWLRPEEGGCEWNPRMTALAPSQLPVAVRT